MAGLIFYTNPMSRGRIARWMLEEVGADYETRLVDFRTGEKPADFLAANPMGKVPAIVHRGHVVTETAAICAYLAEAFPEAGLAPRADAERASYLRWMFFAAGPLESAVTNKALGCTPDGFQQTAMAGYGSYDRTIDTLEQAIAAVGAAWLAGDRFTACDLYVGSHLMWGLQFGTLPKRDAFTTYTARLAERPAYRRATEIDDTLMDEESHPG